MKVTTRAGNTYKVQFVHSSHDFEQKKLVTPGGLRQFVDNLALSLDRRISFADISLVESNGTPDENGTPRYKYTSLAQGFAVCYYKDQFRKDTGRAIALDRALLNSDISYTEQDEVWEACWSSENNKVVPLRPSEVGALFVN